MQILGVLTTLAGLILSIVGIGVGFWKLAHGDEIAMFWLSLVPLGFIGLLAGVTLTQLSKKP